MSSAQVDVTQVARGVIGKEAVDLALADGGGMTLDEAIERAGILASSRENYAADT